MAKKQNPPKQSGLKFLPGYAARLGQMRKCAVCGVEKEINWSNFVQAKKYPDHVSPVCRQCQGRAAGLTSAEMREKGFPAPDKPKGWPDPFKDRKKYWEKVWRLTDRLYELADKPREEAEFKSVVAELNKVTRVYGDPAGGGQQKDPEIAFRTFAHVLSRLINNFTQFAEIHDVDIIPALMDEKAEQTLILASRNSGKSTIVEIYVTWLLHRNPLEIIGVISGGVKRAKRTLRTVRLFIEQCPLLRPLIPDDNCLDSADQFVVPAANGRLGSSVSFASFGISSNMVGMRFNVALLDDVETKTDRSPAAQENLDLLTSEVQNILNPGGRVIALGTPQVAGLSIYARWAKSEDWKTYRALLFEELPQDHGDRKRPYLRSRWPSRWSDADLEKKRRNLPAREWDLHWRIDLSALDEDDRPLKLRDFITVRWDASKSDFPTIVKPGGKKLTYLETGVADADDYFQGPSSISPDTSRYVATIAAVDPASGVVGRDEAGVAVVSVTTQGLAVVRCVAGVRGSSSAETLVKVAALLHSFYPTKIVCEARADSLYPSQLASVLARRGYACMVDPVQSGAKKGERILDAIGVPLADHRVVMLESVISGEDAMETIKQITHCTADGRQLRHDDRVDALAWALATVSPMLLIDEADGLEMASRLKMEELLALPLRKGGITEDGIEAAMFEANEDEERLQMKLQMALERQEAELREGIVDPNFAAYIQNLQNEVAKLRRYQ